MAETLEFELVAPTELVLSEAVNMVVVPGGEGDFGVLPGHTPLVSTVRPGVINVYDDLGKVTKSIFVEGGFAEVTETRCTVLAEKAMPVEKLTRDVAEKRLQEANDALMKTDDEGEKTGARRELAAAQAMVDAAGG